MSKEQQKDGASVPATRKFRVKPGAKFYPNDGKVDDGGRPVMAVPGSLVDLTEAQAKAFGDLVETV